MKRYNYLPTILLLIASFTGFSSQAQKGTTEPFRKGSVTASLGVGVGNNYNDSRNAFGTKGVLEFGVWNAGPGVISLGAEVGATFSSKYKYEGFNDYRSRTVIVAGRSAWHHGWNVQGLDTYAGLSAGVGFRHFNYTRNSYVAGDDVIPVFGAFVGASYFVAPAFGFNIEAGHDITSLQAGVIFKLR